MNEPQKIKFQGKTYYGFKTCPVWLKQFFINQAKNKCQECSNTKNLEIHRCHRGVEGGLYVYINLNHVLSNCKVLCHPCHEKYNYSRKLPSFTTKKGNIKYINNI